MSKIGWGAVPVRGFIPPWAFMEFQALGILPIACDMRTSEHLTYTPAPDIVHESAGHSPIIINEEYAYYLKEYGRIASKAIFSENDQKIYYAIRKLSDIKEDRNASKQEISQAEEELRDAKSEEVEPSEATLLSRLHWWTVEYGLIGSLKNPKIYGAGLLSSVGESQNCLSSNVEKIPLTIDCVNYNYDITEQQPQLFVINDFSDLVKVLHEFEKSMAYKNTNNKEDKSIIDNNELSILNQVPLIVSNDESLIKLYQKFDLNKINLEELISILDDSYSNEWLLRFNAYKRYYKSNKNSLSSIENFLLNYKPGEDINDAIIRGLELIKNT